MKNINRKLVWITGASSGIGKELCYKFSEEGWNIALTARRKSELEKISKMLNNKTLVCSADVKVNQRLN